MGRRLIIRGADFSNVAVSQEEITWAVFNDVNWADLFSGTNAYAKCLYGRCMEKYDFNAIANKTIIGIKVGVATLNGGVLQVGVVRNMKDIAIQNSLVSYDTSAVETQTVTASKVGTQILYLETPIVVGNGDWIGIGNLSMSDAVIPSMRFTSSVAGMCYVNGKRETAPYYDTIDDHNPATSGGYAQGLAIDFVYSE